MTIQEKAIEQLERISTHLSSIGEKEDYTDIAIQALEQARWIPVSERLPEKYEIVLLTNIWREVEKAIIQNVKNFIMTFGRDFTFVGNQYHLEKYGHHSYPDLLFYNRELAALVVVELKRGDFKPAYLGQLSAYLRILDTEVKKPFENPSIGIILCKRADKSFVEFLIQGYDNPMGVATYKSAEDVRKVLPTEEELRRVMDDEPEKA